MQMWMDLCSTLAVAAAARLGIADVLADAAPQECAALARAVGADATALTRLLRTLVSLGILAQPHPQTYTLTPLGAVLRSDHPGSMRDLLIAVTDPPHVQAWSKLHASVTSGQPMVPALFGMPIFAYYAAHPDERAAFSRAMGNLSALAAQGIVHHYDFAHARHIVDVGGAHGDLLLTILQASPHARGTVFDLPHVADAARQAIAAHGYAARCEAVGGDFFQAVPPGGDVYILKLIVHDWPDTEAVRILHTLPRCHAARRHAARDRDGDSRRSAAVAGAYERFEHARDDRGARTHGTGVWGAVGPGRFPPHAPPPHGLAV